MTKNLMIVDERVVLGKEFRIYGTNENPLFLAKDVANWIEYDVSNVSKMLKNVDEDEKTTRTISTNGSYKTEAWFLTEEGLYEVLMQSRKPIAKEFKKEVKKILKQIRQTGGYIPVNNDMSDSEIMARALLIANNTIAKKDELIRNQQEQLIEQKPKVEYYDTVLQPKRLMTTSSIAKDLGMSAIALNNILKEKKIIFKQDGCYVPYSKYQYLITDGYADYRITEHGQNLCYTEKGRQWIIELVGVIQ